MRKLSTAELMDYADKLKYVRNHLGKLYFTKMPENALSLRDAKLGERAKGLIKIDELYVKLPLIGYDGEYKDSALSVLRSVPEELLEKADAFSYKVMPERGISGINDVDARVTLYSDENQ